MIFLRKLRRQCSDQMSQLNFSTGNENGVIINSPTVPGYNIIKRIDAGSMAQGWVVRQRKSLRMAILKVYQCEEFKSHDARSQFLSDLEPLVDLNSKGSLAIYKVWQSEDSCSVLTEYTDAPRANDIIRGQGPLLLLKAIAIAMQIARTLADLWNTTGIPHGGLKPGSVFISESGKEGRNIPP